MDKTLKTSSGWEFRIAEGKRGRYRWLLYDAAGKYRASGSIRGFPNPREAETDLREVAESLDKKFLASLFVED